MSKKPTRAGTLKKKVSKVPANNRTLTSDVSSKLPALLTDVTLLRKHARQKVMDGAVTQDYRLDKDTIVHLLNQSLATELVCVLRYKRNYYVASGIKGRYVAAEFAQHAIEELAHADQIAERIMQLGGTPDFNPVGLAERSHAEYFAGTNLNDMIRENLVAERIAIESYRAFIQYIGNEDPTTRSMLESILKMEEEHADELSDLLDA
jgi:bacterioferritin